MSQEEPKFVEPTLQELIQTLRQRMIEAVQIGKASEAKTYLDLIERLTAAAQAATTPEQTLAEQRAQSDLLLHELRVRMDRFNAQKRSASAAIKNPRSLGSKSSPAPKDGGDRCDLTRGLQIVTRKDREP